MVHRTVPRFVLVSLCLCVLANFSWAQHGAGSHAGGGGFSAHAGGGFTSHASAGPSFGGQSGFHPAPSRVPGSFYGSPFSHRGPFAPYPFRGPGYVVRPNTGFQHFRSYSRPAAGPRVAQGRVPRSAYLGARNPHYASPVRSHGPTAGSWRSFAAGPSSNRGAGRRTPLSPVNHGPMHFPGRPPVFRPNGVFFNPIFVNAFFFPHPFFFSPFFFPTFTWWWYPPLTFSDSGCPYEDYYHQQQPYNYQPEEGPSEQPSTGEAEQRSEAPEEAPNAPSEQAQEQTTPLASEKPLPDVIEWGKASDAGPDNQPVVTSRGPLIVNLPHHALRILLNQPNSQTTPSPEPALPQSH